MKKRIFKAMWLSVMAVAVVTVSSCSSDVIFDDFMYDNDKGKYQYIEDSNEFKDYINIYNQLFTSIANSIDSKIEFSLKDNIHIDEYSFVYNRLLESFPEYNKMPFEDRVKLIEKHSNIHSRGSKIVRTKSRAVESGITITKAWKSLNNPAPSGITKTGESCYNKGNVYLTIYDSPSTAVTMAILLAMGDPDEWSDNLEFGGYIFDDSSILINDSDATYDSMNLIHWSFGSNAPHTVFHVHPHFEELPESLNSIDAAAKTSIAQSGCNNFVIYNLNGEQRSY